jgi:hypothetical protein
MPLVKATFTGEDGSMGYRTGKEYTLKVSGFLGGGSTIKIIPLEKGVFPCPYAGISTFLKNWNNIQVMSKGD